MKLLTCERADAEVIGHIIILGITITGLSMLTLYAIPAIYSLQDAANLKNVEQAFTVLDTRASRAALGEGLRQVTDLTLGGGSISVLPNSSEPSYILVELKNGTSAINSISIPMGKIVYRLEGREVAYEGGGVWSKYPSGSVMISPPEFHYNGITLTLPAVNVSGTSSTGGKGAASLNIEKKGKPKRIYPTPTFQNPIPENVTWVNITIKSEYYDAWGDFFKSITLTSVYPNSNEKKVTVVLETPPLFPNFSYGALASEEISMDANSKIDSYNSSKGNYLTSKSGNGSIRANKGISIDNNAEVNGSALTGGDITGSGEIKRDAYARLYGSVTILGNKYPAVGDLSVGETAGLVQRRIDEYKTTNNNNDSSAGGCLRGAGNTTLDGKYQNGTDWSTCTISTGNYYLTKFDLPSNTKLTFDTNSGAVNIALDSNFRLDSNTNITVNGNNPVRLYLWGLFQMGSNTEINRNINNDTSTLFQVISSSSQGIASPFFDSNAWFIGFIWAPYAEIKIDSDAQVYGAIVGKKFRLGSNKKIHYDEALQNLIPEVVGTTVRYLHITHNDIEVSIS